MAGNTENIEAKLAAYIDGDLDAQGRAEIEKHLAANPQHRTLIEQLSKQRDLLRELPREEAPEDILEALQNQMERSVLLGDAGEPSERLKISRWPQRFAVAAIVLLTVGLGAIIYFVLPRGNGTGDYAVATRRGATLEGEGASTVSSSPFPSSVSSADEAELKAKSGVDAVASGALPNTSDFGADDRANRAMKRAAGVEDGVAPIAEKTEVARPDVFSPKSAAGAFGGGAAAGSSVAFDDIRAAQTLAQNSAIARQLKDTSGLDDNALVVVVNSADPSGAQSEVTRYLESNKIAWDEVTRPMPGPLDIAQSQVVHLDRAQQSQVPLMKTGERRVETKGGALAEQLDKTAVAAPSGPPAAAAAATPTPSAPAAPQQQQQEQDQQAKTQAPAGVANAGRDVSKSYEPLSNTISADAGLEEATARERMKEEAQQKPLQQQEPARAEAQQQQQQQAPAQQSMEGPQVQQRVADQRVIIARGVTRRQALELSSSLSKQQAIQRADLYDPQVATADVYQRARNLGAPTSQPAVRAGGAETSQQRAVAPTTAPAEDESFKLAATLAPKASDVPAGILPATQPADNRGALADATPLPATHPAAGPTTAPAPSLVPLADGEAFDFAGAATQPTTAAAGVEERVDVVILVNDDASLLQQRMPSGPAQPQQQQIDASQEPATTAPTTAESAPTTQPTF
jgi:hypothetical protein